MGPVIAAVAAGSGSADHALADSRRAAEFAGPDDQGFVEQAAGGEIVEKRLKAWSAGGMRRVLRSMKLRLWVSQ